MVGACWRRQVIPTSQEMEAFDGRLPDANSEVEHEPVRGIIHKYPDRLEHGALLVHNDHDFIALAQVEPALLVYPGRPH